MAMSWWSQCSPSLCIAVFLGYRLKPCLQRTNGTDVHKSLGLVTWPSGHTFIGHSRQRHGLIGWAKLGRLVPSVLIKLGAIGAAALRPFKKSAHGQGRENEKSLLYCVISLVGIILGKLFFLNCCHQTSYFKPKMPQIPLRLCPRPCWRAYSAPPDIRHMNEVNAPRARLVLWWVTVFGRVFHLGM